MKQAIETCLKTGYFKRISSIYFCLLDLGNTGYIGVLTKTYTGIVKAQNRHFPRENLARLKCGNVIVAKRRAYLQHRLLPTRLPRLFFIFIMCDTVSQYLFFFLSNNHQY